MPEKYSPDRFDKVLPYTTQHGRHRQRFVAKPPSRKPLILVILIGGLAIAIGVFSYVLLPQLLSSSDQQVATEPSDEPSVVESAEPSPAPVTTEPESVDITDPQATEATPEDELSADGEATPDQLEQPTESPDAAEQDPNVNTNATVGVYNAGGIAGLAGRTADTLSGAGFNVVTTSNWSGSAVTGTTVYYQNDQATAQAIADALGGGAVVAQTYNIPQEITVVAVTE